MLLSICIPTYNRGHYLINNLEIIYSQVRENNLFDELEINISNNGSTDDTDVLIKSFISKHDDLIINYNCFTKNLGPDKNFIETMHMASGEYSILLGDDDFFKSGSLRHIISLLKKEIEADVYLSNRTEIDEKGNFLRDTWFLDRRVESRIFDFADENQAGFYFSLCRSVGGCLTFISSVIYKTSILDEIGDYDSSLDGTFYSFWYYLWGKLARGGKLYYLNDTYILNTQVANNNYGHGLRRSLVDFEGFQKASNIFFNNKSYINCFLDVPKRGKKISVLSQECIYDMDSYYNQLIPVLKSSNDNTYLEDLSVLTSARYHLSSFANLILPRWIMRIVRFFV